MEFLIFAIPSVVFLISVSLYALLANPVAVIDEILPLMPTCTNSASLEVQSYGTDWEL